MAKLDEIRQGIADQIPTNALEKEYMEPDIIAANIIAFLADAGVCLPFTFYEMRQLPKGIKTEKPEFVVSLKSMLEEEHGK